MTVLEFVGGPRGMVFAKTVERQPSLRLALETVVPAQHFQMHHMTFLQVYRPIHHVDHLFAPQNAARNADGHLATVFARQVPTQMQRNLQHGMAFALDTYKPALANMLRFSQFCYTRVARY
jgi:hypothetical protein